ncbi:LysR family transcriptional regulator [Pseudooceanicola albus]|uniref:LysR family transcriptional regulator n=1 Tax=Pseudooceanicola albus TaxID=2692189 RepID=UPI00137120B8|nr:LysR family transcriptional regulator [Pseudooceanicola albus]
MTLDQIQTFLLVARLGGIRRATEALHLSQPAVSNRILTLEEELSVPLFERVGGGMALTREGHQLLPHAELIEQTVNRIRSELSPPEALRTVLRIGVVETVAECWLRDFLASLHRAYPQVVVEVTVDISVNLREQLLERSLDLVALMGPISDYAVENVALPSVEMHWFKSGGSAEPDLAKTPVITFHRKSRPFEEIRQKLIGLHGSGVRVFPSSALSTGMELVAVGVGVGAFPDLPDHAAVREGRVERFTPGWRPRPITLSACFLREGRGSLVEPAIALLQQVARARAGDDPGGA